MAQSLNDFLAGYISGVAGLLVGSPLDVLKVRLQTQQRAENKKMSSVKILMEMKQTEGLSSYFKGVASPIIGLAVLNSILFTSYGGMLRAFEKYEYDHESSQVPTLSQVYLAGFGAGVACFLVSTPTELVKCRAQANANFSTWNVFKSILFTQGIGGFYQGGLITIIRDAPGYGVYFWVYEGFKRILDGENVSNLLFAGGMAGLLSWGSIYPLDVIKSRLQTQTQTQSPCLNEESSLLVHRKNVSARPCYTGIIDCAIKSYRAEGISVFFRGIIPTLVRAWPVNAVTFCVYEIMASWLQ